MKRALHLFLIAHAVAFSATGCFSKPSAQMLQGAESPLPLGAPSLTGPSPAPSAAPSPEPAPSAAHSPAPAPSTAPPSGAVAWNDLWWLQKASRALRGGDGLRPGEDPRALLALGREQVVQRFLSDARFADSVLDFNMMVLGFRLDRIRKENGNYEDLAYEMPSAITSAQAVLGGGDYFSLFDLQHPVYLGPLIRPAETQDGDDQLDSPTLRQRVYQRTLADLDRLIALAQGNPSATPPVPAASPVDLCTAINEHLDKFIFSGIYSLPLSIPRDLMLSRPWYGNLNSICNDSPIATIDFVAELRRVRGLDQKFFARLDSFEPARYFTSDLLSVRTMDVSDLSPGYQHSIFSFTLQRTLPNSSTNFDRKRAAYVLKRFLCDDLTPVNVEMPAVHAGNRHATDPSCFACHYKLDPMAGFFRDLGLRFRDYSARSSITFDDFSSTDRAQYEKNWQPGPDASHPWNVGYIRSTQDISQNFYGSNVTDLYGFLKSAPEARRCLMKRLFEYLSSDAQTVDGDFLSYLTEQFSSAADTQGSVPALKQAFARIVLSRTFSMPNADPDSCYDYRPGAAPQGGTPCKVSSILAQRCVHCHHSTANDPFLDLSQWKRLPDGSFGFPHLDDSGNPVPSRQTLQQILDRITTTDADSRMPYQSDMPSTERQQLYLWANGMLGPAGGSR